MNDCVYSHVIEF